jgi:hypothetical protein
VAHFLAVFNSLPEFGESFWLQQLAAWLAGQQPRALAGAGVVVPRDLVKEAPDYGEYVCAITTECLKVYSCV